MKKCLLALLCVVGFSGYLHAQNVGILIDAGLLENATGTAAVPIGGLLQLIASPSGTFGAPTTSSYVTGDNVLISSFAMNYGGGRTGETTNGFVGLALTTSNYTLTPGEKLELRFYPSLLYANMPATPTLATTYGQVRSDTIEFGPAGGDPTETAWVVPAAGNSVHFDYSTVSDGGTYANASAFATNVVLVGVIPEPSTYAMFGIGFAGLLGLRAWNRRDYGARRTT